MKSRNSKKRKLTSKQIHAIIIAITVVGFISFNSFFLIFAPKPQIDFYDILELIMMTSVLSLGFYMVLAGITNLNERKDEEKKQKRIDFVKGHLSKTEFKSISPIVEQDNSLLAEILKEAIKENNWTICARLVDDETIKIVIKDENGQIVCKNKNYDMLDVYHNFIL